MVRCRTLTPTGDDPIVTVPDFLTHYTKRTPFRSLTARPRDAWPSLLAGLTTDNTLAHARFGHPGYLEHRFALEERLRAEFLLRGGRPVLDHPYYLVLGRSPWFERHEPELIAARIRLAAIDPGVVSFTYGDSWTSYALCDGSWPRADELARPHHGRLYLLAEILELVAELGVPTGPTRECPDHYVEAQLWAEPPEYTVTRIRKLRSNPRTG
jgi:hypothetical protein